MRPIHMSGVEELGKPVIRAIDRAADERCDVRRSQEAISRKLTHYNHFIVGEAEGRRLRCTSKPRPADRSAKLFGLPL